MRLLERLSRLPAVGPAGRAGAAPVARDPQRRNTTATTMDERGGESAASSHAPERSAFGARSLRPLSLRPPTPGALRRRHAAPPPPACTDLTFAPHHRAGAAALPHAANAPAEVLAGLALDPSLAGVDASRLLYLDTETTGLHGGAGTLPFLIGLAWWEAGALQVRQLFLEAPGREAPLLREVGERLASASALVTFNGKCFDWPLLRTRFVLNRVPLPPARAHLDVLHCARRAFKHRFDGLKLKTLERAVLGHERDDDIDGALIPQAYFDFLDTGDGAQMQRVLDHNADDLVTLAALLGELCRRYDATLPGDVPSDVLALARLAQRAGDVPRAERLAREALAAGCDDALPFLAALASRRGDVRQAATWLEAAAARPGAPHRTAPVHLLLSKLYEHRLKDAARAHHHARLAAAAEPPDAHGRRLARLERRLAVAARAGPATPHARPATAARSPT